jgi:hypothetical protein
VVERSSTISSRLDISSRSLECFTVSPHTAWKTNKTVYIHTELARSMAQNMPAWLGEHCPVPSSLLFCSLLPLLPIPHPSLPNRSPAPPLARSLPSCSAAPLGRDKTYALPPDGDNTHIVYLAPTPYVALHTTNIIPSPHMSFISVFRIDNFSPRVSQSNRRFNGAIVLCVVWCTTFGLAEPRPSMGLMADHRRWCRRLACGHPVVRA